MAKAKAVTKRKAGRPAKTKTKTVDNQVHETIQIDKPVGVVDYQENNLPEAPAIRERSISEVEYEELQALRTKKEKDERLAELKRQDYKYFGDFDKGSAVPAWMLDKQTGALAREVRQMESMIRNKQVPDDEIYSAQEDFERKKTRLDQINASKPVLNGMQKDRLAKVRDNLEVGITASNFTKSEMEHYLVDAHEEAKRMSEPCVEVDKLEAARMGIKTDEEGKVSRNVAEMMWKMTSSLLGDRPNNPNTEMLRKDSGNSKRNTTVVDVDMVDGVFVYPEDHIMHAKANA
jgi:hypothetical protein